MLIQMLTDILFQALISQLLKYHKHLSCVYNSDDQHVFVSFYGVQIYGIFFRLLFHNCFSCVCNCDDQQRLYMKSLPVTKSIFEKDGITP